MTTLSEFINKLNKYCIINEINKKIFNYIRCEDESVMSRSKKEVTIPSSESININNGAELMQETHACFFSLLRDAFTSKGEYRMSATEMKEAVMQWQGNPISPLNDW